MRHLKDEATLKKILIVTAIIHVMVAGLFLATGSSPAISAQEEEDGGFEYLIRVLEDANERGLLTEDLSRTLGDLFVEYLIAPSTGESVQDAKKRLGGNSGDDSGESGEHSESGDNGEESGTQLSLTETFDEVRAGARLILSFDSTANAFMGTVENTTQATLTRVRVEVHLSNGTELGPASPVDLAPGQMHEVNLPAGSEPFTTWSAHPEVG